MNLKSKKGFTLVELIIVIAILGIIALIAVPSLTGVQKRSQVNADIRTAEQIGKTVRIWLTDTKNVTETLTRENAIKSFTTLDSLKGTSSFEEYISTNYKPKAIVESGIAYYIMLKDGKVVVAINSASLGSTMPDEIYEYDDDSSAVTKGVAYIEGTSELTSTTVTDVFGE